MLTVPESSVADLFSASVLFSVSDLFSASLSPEDSGFCTCELIRLELLFSSIWRSGYGISTLGSSSLGSFTLGVALFSSSELSELSEDYHVLQICKTRKWVQLPLWAESAVAYDIYQIFEVQSCILFENFLLLGSADIDSSPELTLI